MITQVRNSIIATGILLALSTSNTFAADTISQDITEARQETQIWTTYALSPYLRANDLKVSVHAGKATLTGTVEESVSKDLAKQIALSVSGIKEVDNQIMIQPDYVPAKASTTRSFGEVIDDATITTEVKSKLLWSKHVSGLAVDVDTKAGKVKLMGSAESPTAKELATRLAMNTHGVVSVDNQLVVKDAKPGVVATTKETARDTGEVIADGWITTKVKSTYWYSSNIHGSDITVNTKDGIVTLSGKVDNGAERALAIEFAQNVRGVKSVESKALKL
ncbi:MAG: BON domain-containing protein [Steroidobacteraceae bacterium]